MRLINFLLFLFFSWSASAQVYDIVVAKDGSGNYQTINEAISAAPTSSARTIIFIKKGIYNEKVYLGSHSVTLNKVISLIGENRDSVIISWDDYSGKLIYYYGSTSQSPSGTPQSATLTINAADFYMENITVQNNYTTKQAVAVYNVSDRQTFKNCRFIGFQDTHYLKKGRRSFFYKTIIEGGTDFICAGGTSFFYQCRIKSLKGGQYITAPEDISYSTTISTGKTLYYGFIFRDCDIINDGQLNAGSVYLGRPWQGTSGSIFMNCRLGNHIRPTGWSTWSENNHLTSFFGEYKSMIADGSALADVSQRVSWSYQLSDADVNNYLLLNIIYSSVSSTPYDPVSLVVPPASVASVSKSGQTLTWDVKGGAKGYVVYADGSVIGFSKTNSFTVETNIGASAVFSVRTVGAHGNLSQPGDNVSISDINNAINTVPTPIIPVVNKDYPFYINSNILFFSEITNFKIYNLAGQEILSEKNKLFISLEGLNGGVYIIKAFDNLKGNYQAKISL